MSTRKRSFAEISQFRATPSRHGPSTPHAIQALQQRSGAKTRSSRSIRHVATDTVRPDSIRGVLRQFAKISAPVTRKRIVTPRAVDADKENQRHFHRDDEDNDNDSILMEKPRLTFNIEETLEDDDSDLPTAPTPSALLDDEDDDNDEQPTITFPNATSIPINDQSRERIGRRKSHVSLIYSEPIAAEDDDEQGGDDTILTERGRRALSEEATGRLSRYSFGSIRMSDFGSQLEIRRDSNKGRLDDSILLEPDDYMPLQNYDIEFGETENLKKMQNSPGSEAESDTIHISNVGDETFRLDMPQDEVETNARDAPFNAAYQGNLMRTGTNLFEQEQRPVEAVLDAETEQLGDLTQHQTLLETAIKSSQASRKKRVKLTRHGTTVPSLPASLIKRIVLQSYEKQSKRKPTLSHDHMKALEQATEWFFDQVGEDLEAYSSHGRRKRRVDTADVWLLMKRQKVLGADTELQGLAKSWLPKDVLKDLDFSEGYGD